MRERLRNEPPLSVDDRWVNWILQFNVGAVQYITEIK